jgi:hypothetical protein
MNDWLPCQLVERCRDLSLPPMNGCIELPTKSRNGFLRKLESFVHSFCEIPGVPYPVDLREREKGNYFLME